MPEELDIMPAEPHFVGLDDHGKWIMWWGKRAFQYSLLFDTFAELVRWYLDYGVTYIINFDKVAAVKEIIGNPYGAALYTVTTEQMDNIIMNYELDLKIGA